MNERKQKKVVFLHSINMTSYRGHEMNIHAGNFGFAQKYGFGFEMYNFLDIGGRHYGFVELTQRNDNDRAIRLENLGASKSASSVDGVLAIWTAPCRDGKGREVVGWYRNATLHRYVVQPKGKIRRARMFTHPDTEESLEMGYRIDADAADCRLLHPDERVLRISYRKGVKGVPGQSSIYYPFNQTSNDAKKLRSRVLAFISEDRTKNERGKRKTAVKHVGGGLFLSPVLRSDPRSAEPGRG